MCFSLNDGIFLLSCCLTTSKTRYYLENLRAPQNFCKRTKQQHPATVI